jgi:hypothetical protein
VRISLSPELMSISLGSDRLGSICILRRWQNEEEERCKKEDKDCARSNLQECWSSFFRHMFSACLLNACLCGLLFEFLHRFGIEIWSCLEDEYSVSVVCNLLTGRQDGGGRTRWPGGGGGSRTAGRQVARRRRCWRGRKKKGLRTDPVANARGEALHA